LPKHAILAPRFPQISSDLRTLSDHRHNLCVPTERFFSADRILMTRGRTPVRPKDRATLIYRLLLTDGDKHVYSLFERVCFVLGRILLSIIFLASGVQKIVNWNATEEKMADEGIVIVPVLLGVAVLFEIAGGLSILLGYRMRVGAILLVLFLIPATLIFHDFWMLEGQERQTQMIHFMKNLTIMGGLLYVIATKGGPGGLGGTKAPKESPPPS